MGLEIRLPDGGSQLCCPAPPRWRRTWALAICARRLGQRKRHHLQSLRSEKRQDGEVGKRVELRLGERSNGLFAMVSAPSDSTRWAPLLGSRVICSARCVQHVARPHKRTARTEAISELHCLLEGFGAVAHQIDRLARPPDPKHCEHLAFQTILVDPKLG
jgi:hypothetical protein